VKNRLGIMLLVVSLGFCPALYSQDYSADLSDVTVKFTRNMTLIRNMSPEPEIKDLIDTVVSQAEDVAGFFRDSNADNIRREIRKYQKELKLNPDIDKKHKEDLNELRQDLREKDEDGNYRTAVTRFRDGSQELIKFLNLIQTTDEKRVQLIRITIEHVRQYQKALSEFPQ